MAAAQGYRRRLAEETGTPLTDLCRTITATSEAVYGTW